MSHTPFELSTDLVEALTEASNAFAKEHHCPTIATGLWCDGRFMSAGATVLHDDGFHPTTESVYRIASMTKSFTAAALL